MSDLTPDERALLAAAETDDDAADKKAAARRRKPELATQAHEDTVPAAPARGPYSPVQFEDDGWGDLPVQMRG